MRKITASQMDIDNGNFQVTHNDELVNDHSRQTTGIVLTTATSTTIAMAANNSNKIRIINNPLPDVNVNCQKYLLFILSGFLVSFFQFLIDQWKRVVDYTFVNNKEKYGFENYYFQKNEKYQKYFRNYWIFLKHRFFWFFEMVSWSFSYLESN